VVDANKTPYEWLGGADTLLKLVDAFYDHVAKHPDLSPIFPQDLTQTKEKQFKFLSQFFGGPPLYSVEYGHPMLRARHMPFAITPQRAQSWLGCMQSAMDEVGIQDPVRQYMLERFTHTANHMVNQPGNV
jgi:hemoglobin